LDLDPTDRNKSERGLTGGCLLGHRKRLTSPTVARDWSELGFWWSLEAMKCTTLLVLTRGRRWHPRVVRTLPRDALAHSQRCSARRRDPDELALIFRVTRENGKRVTEMRTVEGSLGVRRNGQPEVLALVVLVTVEESIVVILSVMCIVPKFIID
jgi:hypothetical protein